LNPRSAVAPAAMAALASESQLAVFSEESLQSMGTYSMPLPRPLALEPQLYDQLTGALPMNGETKSAALKATPRLPPLLPELGVLDAEDP
jgi:hypothetical protein